jgi:hypothetical protein
VPKLTVNESPEFWAAVKGASYEIAFTDRPWAYGNETSGIREAGRFWGMREWFRRLGAVGLVHALIHVHGVPDPARIARADDGDTVRRATEARGRNIEID